MNLNRLYQGYDIECYPNIFTYTGRNLWDNATVTFEISDRMNQITELRMHLAALKQHRVIQFGYNNVGYDYPIIHEIMHNHGIMYAYQIREISDRIINTPWQDRRRNIIPEWERDIQQLDLMLIHHFDSASKNVSLKVLEFNMRSESIEETPISFNDSVSVEDIPLILKYNEGDVDNTVSFFYHSIDEINLRHKLTEMLKIDCTNFNGSKIGEKFLTSKLEKAGIRCFHYVNNKKKPIQTLRDCVKLSEVIFDYIKFESKEFNWALEQFMNKIVIQTKGALEMSVTHRGFQYGFGLGGIHGSVKNRTVRADSEFTIIDIDVKSYYPKLAIENMLSAEHFPNEDFCNVYDSVYKERSQYPKGSVENLAMKLALNGAYGKSNSEHSCLFDVKYTMATTVNGQLLLCMLAEKLSSNPSLTMIQTNTDGMTVKIPRIHVEWMRCVCKEWEELTKLTLEEVEYDLMAVRDVNNYIARTIDGNVKYKGAYAYKGAHTTDKGSLEWHKNHSSLVCAYAASEAILKGVNVRETILNHSDPYDFMICAKTAKSHSMELHSDIRWGDTVVFENVKQQQLGKVTRYAITKSGLKLVKRMPPVKRKSNDLKMSKVGWISRKVTGCNKYITVSNEHEYDSAYSLGYRTEDGGCYYRTGDRLNGVDKDGLVTVFNTIPEDLSLTDMIDYEYYIKKAEKLVNWVSKLL